MKIKDDDRLWGQFRILLNNQVVEAIEAEDMNQYGCGTVLLLVYDCKGNPVLDENGKQFTTHQTGKVEIISLQEDYFFKVNREEWITPGFLRNSSLLETLWKTIKLWRKTNGK